MQQRLAARREGPALEPGDEDLLSALDQLTHHRVLADATAAWEKAHGHPPAPAEWIDVRRALARLERAALIHAEPSLHVEVTALGKMRLARRSVA